MSVGPLWSLFVYNAGYVSDWLPWAGMINIISHRYVDGLLGELADYSLNKKCIQFNWKCLAATRKILLLLPRQNTMEIVAP